ncbi:MAG TPA: hypothetical protein VH092_38220 [Urbifossiella sp.]|nr:hypothetical protein [Urbifossiella sp.]
MRAAAAGFAIGVLGTLLLHRVPLRSDDPLPEPNPTDAPAPLGPQRDPVLPTAPPPRPVGPLSGESIAIPVPFPVSTDGGFAVLKVDQPDEIYQFPRLDAGNKVKLVGRVKRLTVDGIEGGSELDATGLEADGAAVTGAVGGGSTLRLKTTGASVTVRGGVWAGRWWRWTPRRRTCRSSRRRPRRRPRSRSAAGAA